MGGFVGLHPDEHRNSCIAQPSGRIGLCPALSSRDSIFDQVAAYFLVPDESDVQGRSVILFM